MTLHVSLPVPSDNGSGAPVSMLGFASSKTVVCAGLVGATVSIEISNDPTAQTFSVLGTFNTAGTRTFEVACQWMRVTVSGVTIDTAFPLVTVGGVADTTQTANLPVLPGNGAGSPVDVSALPLFKTVHVGGTFDGFLTVEASVDGGATFATAFSFTSRGQQSAVIAANRMRVVRSGSTVDVNNPDTAVVNVAAVNQDAGGGGGSGGMATPAIAFVYRPGSMIPRTNVYSDWATLIAATQLVQGVKFLQIDNEMELAGGQVSFSAGTITYTAPPGAPAIPAAVVGQQMVVSGAGDAGNNGSFFVATRVSATQITFANASGVTDASFVGTLAILGGFTAIVPAAGMPAGGWDMTEIEVTGFTSPVGLQVPNQQFQFGGAASGGDVQFKNWLKTGGDLTVTNLNTVLPANVITAGGVTIEWGLGFTGDTPNLVNNGTAPMWDNSVGSQTLTLRVDGRIGGTSPAINAGNANYSPNPTVAFQLKGNARVAANMVTGTHASAILSWGAFSYGASWGRQQNWTGNIVEPNTLLTRAMAAPAAVNQAAPVPAAAPLTFSTGMVMNSVCSYNTGAADITQQLPIIRAAAPATGAAPTPPTAVAGVLDSTGMSVFVDNASGTHNVIVQPNATTPDTFEDGSASVVVPPGATFQFMSDGISKWKVFQRRFPTAPALLNGPGTLDITREVTNFTSTGAGNAIVLPNGTYKGQLHAVVHSTVGASGTGVITPATGGGNFTNATLTNHWDSFTFQWDGTHWNFVTGFVGPTGLT